MDASISAISLKINELFGDLFLQGLACSSGFIERCSSRLTGQSFAMLNLLHCPNAAQTSLQDMCDTLEAEYGVKMSKQSLDERFNTYAVTYFKSMYGHAVSELTASMNDWANTCKFTHISIMDCMGFKLPDRLVTFYPGSGTKSSIKIGYDFDVLKRAFRDLAIKPGNENDATFLSALESKIHANGLYIKDLGFYKRSHFVKISKAGAFF